MSALTPFDMLINIFTFLLALGCGLAAMFLVICGAIALINRMAGDGDDFSAFDYKDGPHD